MCYSVQVVRKEPSALHTEAGQPMTVFPLVDGILHHDRPLALISLFGYMTCNNQIKSTICTCANELSRSPESRHMS